MTGAVLLGIAGMAIAHDNEAVSVYARSHANKFKTEVPAAGSSSTLGMGSLVTVAGSYDAIDLMSMITGYDPAAGAMKLSPIHASFLSLRLSEKCRPTGPAFTGQNAFGVKRRVNREACERLIAFGDKSATVANGTTVPMTPDQFRRIKSTGVRAEFDMVLDADREGIAVKLDDSFSSASLDYPTETQMRVWFVYGRIEAVRWILPSDQLPVTLWKRQ